MTTLLKEKKYEEYIETVEKAPGLYPRGRRVLEVPGSGAGE